MIVYLNCSTALDEPRGNLEDDLDDFLGDAGEVTGGGGGERGWNIDFEITNQEFDNLLPELLVFLTRWGVPRNAYLKIYPDDWEETEEPRVVKLSDTSIQ